MWVRASVRERKKDSSEHTIVASKIKKKKTISFCLLFDESLLCLVTTISISFHLISFDLGSLEVSSCSVA